jgi:DNA-binding transcriptional MerR regulator
MRLPPRHKRDFLKIGELAADLGITPRTIRFYEELGLISPARTEGGTRYYANRDVKRLGIALRLAHLGIPLENVAELTHSRETCATGAAASAQVLDLIEAMREKVQAMLVDLETVERDLERASVLIRQCADCPNRPNRQDCPHCPVDRHVDLSDIARLIWDPRTP